jgi:phosphatidylserine/phosphatidylglycerophosphate/cardiolipin synthase-like enzyme
MRNVSLAFVLVLIPHLATAEERLCDTAFEDCRSPLLQLIRDERIGINVAFWFMEDARYTAAIQQKIAEGVPVRVLVDTRANSSYPLNADRLEELRNAGVPMRRRVASGILHWKMMLFEGQNTVQFSAANYTSAFVPDAPYENYVDEVIYFTDDATVVNSFRTKYDDLWTDDSAYADYANVSRPLIRRYDTFAKDPELNFPPQESYRNRAVGHYNAESEAIDVIMYRITDRAHTDAMIRALERGIAVRLITEPHQYRDPSRYWHSWNVDRLYAAGAQIRHRAHQGLMHQKSVLLRGQRLTIFGSSNWTSPSSSSQEEHNYFTAKPVFYEWFAAQFERKWTNGTGAPETEPFVPLPPSPPQYLAPSDRLLLSEETSVTLRWNAGKWAHLYDVSFGTVPDPPLVAADQALGPSTSPSNDKVFMVGALSPGTTYYWRIVSKTMARQMAVGPVFSLQRRRRRTAEMTTGTSCSTRRTPTSFAGTGSVSPMRQPLAARS